MFNHYVQVNPSQDHQARNPGGSGLDPSLFVTAPLVVVLKWQKKKKKLMWLCWGEGGTFFKYCVTISVFGITH